MRWEEGDEGRDGGVDGWCCGGRTHPRGSVRRRAASFLRANRQFTGLNELTKTGRLRICRSSGEVTLAADSICQPCVCSDTYVSSGRELVTSRVTHRAWIPSPSARTGAGSRPVLGTPQLG